MATYVVTDTTYDDATFWSSIVEDCAGHVLDFSQLPAKFEISINPRTCTLSIWNGARWFLVGEDGAQGRQACFGALTQLAFFTSLIAVDGRRYGVTDGVDPDPSAAEQIRPPEPNQTDAALLAGDGAEPRMPSLAAAKPAARAKARLEEASMPVAPPIRPGATPRTLTVQNTSDAPVDLCWIDAGGGRHRFVTLLPGDIRHQNIWSSDRWILRKSG